MNEELIKKILKIYNLEAIELFPEQKGYRNRSYPVLTEKGKVNLILYKNENGILDRIKRANEVSNYLNNLGFPTRKAINIEGNDIIKISNQKFTRYLSLYNYLEGETILWEGYSMKHLKLLGKTMSDMHYALVNFNFNLNSKLLFPSVVNELTEIKERMQKYFSNEGVKLALKSKLALGINLDVLDNYSNFLISLEKLEKQILHMDFVRSNILFTNKDNELEISGILDFEKVSIGPRIVDIARTLAFLIVDCKYEKEQKIRKYFLHSGYVKRGRSELTDLSYLNRLINFFWIYDLYKFLKHNPYEDLLLNEHYLRTVEKLKNSGINFLSHN